MTLIALEVKRNRKQLKIIIQKRKKIQQQNGTIFIIIHFGEEISISFSLLSLSEANKTKKVCSAEQWAAYETKKRASYTSVTLDDLYWWRWGAAFDDDADKNHDDDLMTMTKVAKYTFSSTFQTKNHISCACHYWNGCFISSSSMCTNFRFVGC